MQLRVGEDISKRAETFVCRLYKTNVSSVDLAKILLSPKVEFSRETPTNMRCLEVSPDESPLLGIPRLELIAGHMVTNLIDNVGRALTGYNIFGAYGWLDSTVPLYWIKNNGNNLCLIKFRKSSRKI